MKRKRGWFIIHQYISVEKSDFIASCIVRCRANVIIFILKSAAGLPEFFNVNIPKFRNKYTNSPKNIPKFLKILTQYIQLKQLILPCSKWLFVLWKLGHLPQNLTYMKNQTRWKYFWLKICNAFSNNTYNNFYNCYNFYIIFVHFIFIWVY